MKNKSVLFIDINVLTIELYNIGLVAKQVVFVSYHPEKMTHFILPSDDNSPNYLFKSKLTNCYSYFMCSQIYSTCELMSKYFMGNAEHKWIVDYIGDYVLKKYQLKKCKEIF